MAEAETEFPFKMEIEKRVYTHIYICVYVCIYDDMCSVE